MFNEWYVSDSSYIAFEEKEQAETKPILFDVIIKYVLIVSFYVRNQIALVTDCCIDVKNNTEYQVVLIEKTQNVE